MKFIVLAVIFVAGVSAQYGIPDEDDKPMPLPTPVRASSYESPAPVRVLSSYEAPAPVRVSSYESPAPVRVLTHYEAPAPVVTPVRTVINHYEAPAPVRVLSSYESPAPVRVLSSYESPAPVRVLSSYEPTPVRAVVEVSKPHIPIVELKVDDDHYGTYSVKSVSGDGTTSVENAHLKNLGDPEGPVSVSSGAYSFIGDDGKTYTTRWTADEQGFHAEGEHLPTSPPIPEEIRQSLVENRYASHVETPVVRVAPLLRSGY